MYAIEHDTRAKRFFTEISGHQAELDYTLSGAVMTIHHTSVPPPIGGKGVAAELMRAAITAAKAQGWTIHPTCSYAVAYLKKHPLSS